MTEFTVVDTNGVHLTDMQFCGCYGSPGGSQSRNQLLRAGLLPSTHARPVTAFTFDVLDSFHLLTLQGKTTAYDFYYSLAHKSDNTRLLDVKVCEAFALPFSMLISRIVSLFAISDCNANMAAP